MKKLLLRRNILILPGERTAKFAIKLSRMVAKSFSTRFTLHDKDAIPHVTITSVTYPSRRQQDLDEQINQVVSSYLPIKISMGKASIFQDVLFWNVILDKQFYRLHESIVGIVNSIRENHYHPEDESWAPKGTPLRERLVKYGYPLTYDLFIPHITLTEIENSSQYEDAVNFVNEKLGSKQRSFEANSLALGSAGHYGVCPEIIAVYKNTTK